MTEIYEFIDGEKGAHPVGSMCEWMGVSRSGFHDWRTRPNSVTVERRETVKDEIGVVFAESRRTYGYRRVHAALAREGIHAGPELVRALMRELDLVPIGPRPRQVTTVRAPDADATPDLIGRDFTADRPGEKLVGDITYVPTGQGWLYLATVIDRATRKIIGWAAADHMRTSLVCDAITMATTNTVLVDNVVFHSDRGTQCTSAEFRNHLRDHGVTPSLGRTGVCWDNALAESFFATLKNELVHTTTFHTRAQARREIGAYIAHTSAVMTVDPMGPHTAHPLGGAVLGKATDAYGRLHGHRGLYCLGGALVPGSAAAINPSLTIAALVERSLDHIIGDFTDSPV